MGSVKRAAAVVGAVAAMAAGVGVVVAPPAVAGVNCNSGNHCVFYTTVNSAKHQYFNTDTNFSDDFFSGGDGTGAGANVNNNTWAASNSSTGGFESHYYDGFNHSGFLFCVNPGDTVHSLPSTLRDRASSLRLRGTTTIRCLSN